MVSSRSLMGLLRCRNAWCKRIWCKGIEQARDERVPRGGIGLLDSETAKHECSRRKHRAEARERLGRDRVGDAAVLLGAHDDVGKLRLAQPEALAEQRGEIVVSTRRRKCVDEQRRWGYARFGQPVAEALEHGARTEVGRALQQ